MNDEAAPQHVGDRMVEAVRRNRREDIYLRLRAMCRNVQRDPRSIGVYSTGERCAIALIMNKPKLLPPGDTMLYAADRVGQDWLPICLQVQRDGWNL